MSMECKRSGGGRRWACRNNWCRKKRGIVTGTFFEEARLKPQEVFQLSYNWCRGKHSVSEIQYTIHAWRMDQQPDRRPLSIGTTTSETFVLNVSSKICKLEAKGKCSKPNGLQSQDGNGIESVK
ncbi:hypothetical protein AB6A40_003785 [Gnathostoma spinigerum]|uniref:Uncharacterized protein n=1 Tax=Gnathostoma spinigerum TaxID=75299 RepID=A0ABD6EBP8_9BILA